MTKKRLKVTIGDAVGIADLLEDAAPKTAAAVWDALPLDGAINHANFSGEEASFPCYPLMYEKENQLFDCEHGDLGYFVQGPAICVYYGTMRVISPGNVFARITENLDAIKKVCRGSWKETGVPILIEKYEGQ
jgi:hypothetical protein